MNNIYNLFLQYIMYIIVVGFEVERKVFSMKDRGVKYFIITVIVLTIFVVCFMLLFVLFAYTFGMYKGLI